MKVALATLFFLSACGRSECQDYARIVCDKLFVCFGIEDRAKCEADQQRHNDALRITEAECAQQRDRLAAMTCKELRDLVAQTAR